MTVRRAAGIAGPSAPRKPGRRRLLAGLACVPLHGIAQLLPDTPRTLALHHLHTDERLSVTYFASGEYLPEAIIRIETVLRDFRTGELHAIDVQLLDTMSALSQLCGQSTFEVISGYRSPLTNAQLHAKTDGVAANSLHVEGRAIDVRLRGFDTAQLREAAITLGRGGVGYYAQSNFVHLDTGRVRSWG
jgi:uncharacterized protein YcbK (DUF882 family)